MTNTSLEHSKCFRAGIPLVSQWRVGAVGPLCETGTHRSDSGRFCLCAVGIAFVHVDEDVDALLS